MGYKAGTYSYVYDLNGNILTDISQGLGTSYNLLNLPNVNTLSTGTVTYTYDATGQKVRKVNAIGTPVATDYIDGIQYDGGTITFIQTKEGRAVNSGGTYNYGYNLSDHLGNSRLTFDTHTGAISTTQRDDYTPLGMDISIGSIVSPQDNYLYNHKELQREVGLYDYGARFYDPVIARWNTIDPKAEKSRRWSPYNYVVDNLMRYIDPDGMFFDDYKMNKNGDIQLVKKNDDKTDRIVKTDSKGNVKTNSKGKAKTAIGGIEKGILKDGINF